MLPLWARVDLGAMAMKEYSTFPIPVNHETNTPVTPSDNTPINSMKDLIEAYLDQFDQISNFAGEYHIVL